MEELAHLLVDLQARMNGDHRPPYKTPEDFQFLKYVDDTIHEKIGGQAFQDISVFRARIRVNPAVYKRPKTTGFLRDHDPCDTHSLKYLWEH